MMKGYITHYILSDNFDYKKMICSDAGPAIAEDYDWVPVKIQPGIIDYAGPIIVDNRLPHNETEWLAEALMRRTGPTFLRIVDDYGPENVSHWWYRFVQEMLSRKNVGVLHTYTPTEYLKSLMETAELRRFVHAPYVYQPEHELPINSEKKKNRILFSGNTHKKCYPEREIFLQKARWSPHLRAFVSTLKHPGYPDIGHQLVHDKTGRAYLEAVAEYKYAFVSPGRTSSEFLKYREFAYAGTCPVGHLPTALDDCPEDAFVRYDGSAWSLVARTILTNDHGARAIAFRKYMREKRDRTKIRERVYSQLLSALN